MLQQDQGEGSQPIAFTSQKMNLHERNYSAYDKELLAIVHMLKQWRAYLEGNPFIIYSDHAMLKHIQDQPMLTGRPA